MDAINIIITKLNEVFAPMDAKVLEDSKVWAKDRKQALRNFKDSDEYRAMRRDQGRLYARLHAIAGGKTWYNVFDGRNDEMVEEFVVKNCAEVAAARNANIAAKLQKAGVSEVESSEFQRTKDGFNGVFVVSTDAGKKVVTINTIYAGGHNIQCLHLRVLVKVR